MEMDMNAGSGGLRYSDLEVQHFDAHSFFDGVGDSAAYETELNFDVLPDTGGLDSHELAELVGFRRLASVSFDSPGADGNIQPSNIEFRGSFGANLQAPEENVTGTPNVLADDPDAPGSAVFEVRGIDAPGVFDRWHTEVQSSFASGAQGTGGAGGAPFQQDVQIWYTDHLEHGPVLDANDDLSTVYKVINDRQGYNVEAGAYFTLYWRLHEVEEVRNQYDLPD